MNITAFSGRAEALPLLIGGERVPAASGETLDAVNPATGEVLGRIPRGGEADVDAAVRAAHDAFGSWRRTHPQERAARLLRFAELLGEHADELALIDVRDNGSPLREMRKDVDLAVTQLRYF